MSLEEKQEALRAEEDVFVTSIDDSAEALVERDLDDDGKIVIVPMDDCIIEVVWSYEHERLVGVVRETPERD